MLASLKCIFLINGLEWIIGFEHFKPPRRYGSLYCILHEAKFSENMFAMDWNLLLTSWSSLSAVYLGSGLFILTEQVISAVADLH